MKNRGIGLHLFIYLSPLLVVMGKDRGIGLQSISWKNPPPRASGVMLRPGGHTHFRCHAHFRTSDAMLISDDVQMGGHLR